MRIAKCGLRKRRTRTSELNAAQWNGLRTLPLFVRIFRIPVPQSAFRNPHFTCQIPGFCWLCSENCKTRLYGFVWALNRQTVMIRIDYRLLAISPLLLAFGGFLLLRASAADPTAWIERSIRTLSRYWIILPAMSPNMERLLAWRTLMNKSKT